MHSFSNWCTAHLAKPGIADPFLDRALDGVRRMEALADEFRAERHRQHAHEQRMTVLIEQMQVEAARARSLGDRLDGAIEALEAVLQAQRIDHKPAAGTARTALAAPFGATRGRSL